MIVQKDISELLARRLLQKDTTALDYLYDHYSAALFGIIDRTLQNRQLAEEVLHDVFIKIWDQIEKYDPAKGTLFTWMYRIARNQAIDARRSRDFKHSEKSTDISDYVDMFESDKTNSEDFIGWSSVLKEIGETCKKLIHLNFFMGYSHKEIGEQESIPLGTVKTRLRNCLKNIRTKLGQDFE